MDLPPEVIEMIAHYRRLLGAHDWDWGDDRIDMFRWARFSLLGDVFTAFAATGDWPSAVRSVVGIPPPAGIVIVHVDQAGALSADVGRPRTAIPGRAVAIDVVIDSAMSRELAMTVAGRTVNVAARGAAIEVVDLDGADPTLVVALGGDILRIGDAVRTVPEAELCLRSPRCARWSVIDSSGGGWFPDGLLAKWDVHHQPFFHGHTMTLKVPAEPLRIVCTRGMEFDRTEQTVSPAAGHMATVDCDPPRRFDPALDGWYGGDLHIHMNYSGDLVCTPADAARMQLGEGLHLANFVAANCQTSLVYDRVTLEQFADRDLPWSTTDLVARMGVEYRNDMLGHVHALGPRRPPTRYYAGHERSDHPEDWPPNKTACVELRAAGATVGYAHPAFSAFPGDWSTDRFFDNPRSVEARELVADAAVGVVDSIDLISPFDDEGAMFLYHRLLSCGLRLAATAGTDTFLSFAHGPGVASNPPGWGRVYAHLDDQPLSVATFKQAIREGRTMVTNGPWLSLAVNDRGPGAVLDSVIGDPLDLRVQVQGGGVDRLALVGPDGLIAERAGSSELRTALMVREPTWIAAIARGPANPATLDATVFAHTSPVYIDLASQRVARRADAQWCLDLLGTLERFVAEHGHFERATRESRFGDLVGVLDDARAFYRDVIATAGR